MLSEARSGAAAAFAAAELARVVADFDRACGVRRRGARWRFRAGLFGSPVSAFAALCLLIGLLAGHRLRPLDPHRACRDACTATSPALGARRGGNQEEAVDMDSNASYAGEVERNVCRTTIFRCAASFIKSTSS